MQNAAESARRETAMYRAHLKQLDDERILEEKKLTELLEIHRKEVEEKQSAARCKIIEAKRQLQKVTRHFSYSQSLFRKSPFPIEQLCIV